MYLIGHPEIGNPEIISYFMYLNIVGSKYPMIISFDFEVILVEYTNIRIGQVNL